MDEQTARVLREAEDGEPARLIVQLKIQVAARL